MKVITFSRYFPKGHPREGQQTGFVEKIWRYFLDANAPMFPYWMDRHPLNIDIRSCYDCNAKHHTIRAGTRWKEGEHFNPKVWSGRPYHSKQIAFAPPIKIEKVWNFSLYPGEKELMFSINNNSWAVDWREGIHWNYRIGEIARNDGLDVDDFMHWFIPSVKKDGKFFGQIICWNPNIDYSNILSTTGKPEKL
jgi:hypothetical protein